MASLSISLPSSSLRIPVLTRKMKLVALAATLGLSFIGLLARYLKRRRKRLPKSDKKAVSNASWKSYGPVSAQQQNGGAYAL